MSSTPKNIFTPSPRPAPTLQTMNGAIHQQLHLAKQLQDRGELDPAIQIYESALKVLPNNSAILSNLTACLIKNKQSLRAIEFLKKSLKSTPQDKTIRTSLIAAYISSNNSNEALKEANQNIEFHPTYAPALFQRAQILTATGNQKSAIIDLRKATTLSPDNSKYIQTLASQLLSIGEYQEALALFKEQSRNNPNSAEILSNYASTEAHCGATSEAIKHFDLALTLDRSATALLKSAVARIPIVDDGHLKLHELEHEAIELLTEVISQIEKHAAQDAFILATHASSYYLAYQDKSHRKILDLLGDVCTKAMQESAKYWKLKSIPDKIPANISTHSKLRVGFVSAHIKNHSVWNAITRGWIKLLNESGHHIAIINLGTGHDDMTVEAKNFCHEYICHEMAVKEWAKLISEKQFDVLIYPEIAMSQLTRQLASLRLAGVQATSWGHPQSSGLSTIDYYLSGELFEPTESQENYREQLIKLPGLGVAYEPVTGASEAFDITQFGINKTRPIFICAGTPIKYHRKYDDILIKLAKNQPDSQFLFFRHPLLAGAKDVILKRMRHSFQLAGLDFDFHYREVSWLSPSQFKYLMEQATAFLDTTVFSGFNTVLQALDAELPVVTKRGQYLRSNLGAAPLEAIGMGDTVCNTDDEFIALAVQLTDRNYRQQLSNRIKAGMSQGLTPPDLAESINKWLERSCAGNKKAPTTPQL